MKRIISWPGALPGISRIKGRETVAPDSEKAKKGDSIDRWWAAPLIIALVFTVLYLASLYKFALYYSLTELSISMMAFGIFAVTWNSRRFINNNYIVFLGISFFFYGILIVFHTLAYPGIGIFQEQQPQRLLTETAIAGRYVLSLSFLIAPLLLNRKLRAESLFLVYMMFVLFLLASIFYWKIFPPVVGESGVTLFGKVGLYMTTLIYLGSLWLLFRYRQQFDGNVLKLLAISIAAAIGSEVAFVVNDDVSSLLYLFRHFLGFISLYLVYRAFVETGLTRPFDVMFHNLRQSEEALSQKANELAHSNQELQIEVDSRKRHEEELGRSREQLRNFSRHLEFAREEERRGIAREIHDDLGQILTALKMDITLLSRGLPLHEKSYTDTIQRMSGFVNSAAYTVHNVSTKLRPKILDDLGLGAAIDWQVKEFQKHTGIKCKLNVNAGQSHLSETCATTIFRILQESLTNVARHSQSTAVEVSFGKKSDKFVLMVRDNGRGISAGKISDPRSFGLTGMRERARFCDGDIEITGVEGKGTTVTLSVPAIHEEVTRDKNTHR